VVFESDLQRRYELGQVSSREFYDIFCRETATQPDYQAMARAGSEIFMLRAEMLPLVAQLGQAGSRLGILSNTCEIHWEYCLGRFRILTDGFQVHALSYRLGVCKPDAAIFQAAAELAGVEPGAIFFVDDLPQHVAGARAVGFDAVQYTSTRRLADDLRQRGIRLNY
jgi:FMN phosphatase YigB (HAD superfamily)